MLDNSLGKLLLMDKMDIDDLKVPFTNYVGLLIHIQFHQLVTIIMTEVKK